MISILDLVLLAITVYSAVKLNMSWGLIVIFSSLISLWWMYRTRDLRRQAKENVIDMEGHGRGLAIADFALFLLVLFCHIFLYSVVIYGIKLLVD